MSLRVWVVVFQPLSWGTQGQRSGREREAGSLGNVCWDVRGLLEAKAGGEKEREEPQTKGTAAPRKESKSLS